MNYRLLDEFERLFSGKRYLHRASGQGDFVAMHLYEDLVTLDRSAKLNAAVDAKEQVLNTQNRRHGINARRGDGTFGELVPGEKAISYPGYRVSRGPVATVEIGVEVKILAKAMIKQIDRVINDLRNQVVEFKRGGGNCICVAIVGINQAAYAVGYEGDREYRTGGGDRHPIQEAAEAERRLVLHAKGEFDEFIILRYVATNDEPYGFAWADRKRTEQDYGSSLVRISREYDRRF